MKTLQGGKFSMTQCHYSLGDDKGVLALLDYETETVSTWLPVPSSITSIAACLQKQSLLAVG